MLANEPVDVPSDDLELAVVGLSNKLQQTPLSVNSEPSLEVTSPPPKPVDVDDELTIDDVTVGLDATVRVRVLEVPEPHALFASTEIVPPLAPGIAEIDADVELPLQPDGKVHVYDEAPGTAVML